ncbi:hypothetical protein TNCV_174761 [Trichonephila clavipes]|nr:hypothetical protein TNCV_174761 [Trichonephila clavipes]
MYNKLLLYTAVLRPILTYGSPVWGYAADSNIKTLEVAQNSIIRNITVFGIPEKRLLCTWHVDRIWRHSISRLITKKEIQVEAYKIVRSLLVETDEAAFELMLKEVLKVFDEKEEVKEFKIYFEQTYSKRSEVWAYCHRKCKNFKEINSTILEERSSLDSCITGEEMIICEDRKALEKEAHVDNLRARFTLTEISKEEFQKECMQLINKTSPEQYKILSLLRNTLNSSHLFPEANQEF